MRERCFVAERLKNKNVTDKCQCQVGGGEHGKIKKKQWNCPCRKNRMAEMLLLKITRIRMLV